jgi:hypothetical protein
MRKHLHLFCSYSPLLLGQSKAQYYNKRIVKDAWATTYNSCALIGDTLFVSGIYGWKNAIQNQKPLLCKYTLSGELVKQFFFYWRYSSRLWTLTIVDLYKRKKLG